MSESYRQFYVTSVSSATVVLSPANGSESRNDYGGGLAQISVTTTEATANASFWGITGTCGVYEVIIRRKSA